MLKSFRDAWNGIVLAVRTQRNVRVQLIVMVLMMAAGVYLSISYIEWCLAILAMGLVMGLEVMNTSIEELVNFISPERSEEARRIKDLAAGAVLLAAIAAAVVGALILFSKLS
jgi:diacylglycerol kinase (ATP)